MTIHSLRSQVRPDNLKTQVRVSQSVARRLYLVILFCGICWIVMQFVGPMIFLHANGLVLARREVVTTAFPAQVLRVSVRPGDRVAAGEPIATVISTQMLDLLSKLNTQYAKARTQQVQIQARLAAIAATLPAADKTVNDTLAAARAVERAKAGGFSTVTREAEIARARYDAIREAASMRAEAAALRSERKALNENLVRIDDALRNAQKAYNKGTITVQNAGFVGPTVVSPGTVLTPGEKVAEIYHGRKHVIAYLSTNRLYSLEPGQKVIVTDGLSRQSGLVERVDAIADRIPAEFQPSLSSVERRQVVRIALDDSDIFPLLATVQVKGAYTPSNLIAGAGHFIKIAALKVAETLTTKAPSGKRTETIARAADQ